MMHGTFNSRRHPWPRAARPPLLATLLWVGSCVIAGALLAGSDANASDDDCGAATSDCGLQPAGPIGGPTPPIKPAEKYVREPDRGNSLSNKARANAAADKARVERGAATRGAQKLESLPSNEKAVGSGR
ncbi:hypothetical protein ACI2UK_25720 [Ralstonia nicotianae]|uniref:hypothetical protein n=1 Tax=Ralstonia pseudosolanacearum TaxID=1310165 RepID=UPI0020032CAB|nr:hypothetical protein [Ralstonia pseudosolanacearum]MCK4120652.1 hypothetical protein [Ralstonia pseudosolanacearum]